MHPQCKHDLAPNGENQTAPQFPGWHFCLLLSLLPAICLRARRGRRVPAVLHLLRAIGSANREIRANAATITLGADPIRVQRCLLQAADSLDKSLAKLQDRLTAKMKRRISQVSVKNLEPGKREQVLRKP